MAPTTEEANNKLTSPQQAVFLAEHPQKFSDAHTFPKALIELSLVEYPQAGVISNSC